MNEDMNPGWFMDGTCAHIHRTVMLFELTGHWWCRDCNTVFEQDEPISGPPRLGLTT